MNQTFCAFFYFQLTFVRAFYFFSSLEILYINILMEFQMNLSHNFIKCIEILECAWNYCCITTDRQTDRRVAHDIIWNSQLQFNRKKNLKNLNLENRILVCHQFIACVIEARNENAMLTCDALKFRSLQHFFVIISVMFEVFLFMYSTKFVG